MCNENDFILRITLYDFVQYLHGPQPQILQRFSSRKTKGFNIHKVLLVELRLCKRDFLLGESLPPTVIYALWTVAQFDRQLVSPAYQFRSSPSPQ